MITNMAFQYLTRSLEGPLQAAADGFPAMMLTGPRQSGKTTLLKKVFSQSHTYVSLELPDIREAAESDPRGFLDRHQAPVIFDEVQAAPDLLFYIKGAIDTHRERKGQYILSGSQNLLLMQQGESLAGRTAVLQLLPLSWREIRRHPDALLPWQTGWQPADPLDASEFWRLALRGGYPELHAEEERDSQSWHAAYVQTYLERDVRSLRQVGDLGDFQRFMRLLASRSAQQLNITSLARDLGLAVNTAKAWISVLEASHQILLLRPYAANIGKRLAKTPKVYFTDLGTLCYLVGLRDPLHAADGPMAGAIVETAVVNEVQRSLLHLGQVPWLHYMCTSDKIEVDLLVEWDAGLIPIEVKASSTPRPVWAKNIHKLRSWIPDLLRDGYAVHLGEERLPISPGVTALPFGQL
ncbi:MAG: ATP-binding protein [Deltaproteobacteria bacterium]|nr:ATP-binding protein [Deltaproteobacteria bacterium]